MDEKNIIKINNGISLMGSILNHIEIYVEELVLIVDENEDDIRDELIRIVIDNLHGEIKNTHTRGEMFY